MSYRYPIQIHVQLSPTNYCIQYAEACPLWCTLQLQHWYLFDVLAIESPKHENRNCNQPWPGCHQWTEQWDGGTWREVGRSTKKVIGYDSLYYT